MLRIREKPFRQISYSWSLSSSNLKVSIEFNSRKYYKGINEDIVELNISNLHKALFLRTKSTKTLKNRLSMYFLLKTVLCITLIKEAKIV